MMTKPATILLVEDDQSMLEGMHDLLQLVDIGYDVEVLTANNGLVGLEVMEAHTPDLIVSDIMMPKMDGYQFIERVRQNPDWVHIPLIFLTAKGAKQDIHKGRAIGADLYITKPFNSNDFVELVKSQLDRTFQLQTTRRQNFNDLKKEILQILNHEFRTPLTYVTAYYEMLADSLQEVESGENFHEYLRGIQVGCVRLTKLVEDFIKVIELRTGERQKRIETEAAPLHNVDELLQEVIESYQPSAQEQHVMLTYEPAGEVPAVWGEPASLREIFGRLLENGIKFTRSQRPQGGTVTVSTGLDASAGRFRIIFADEGMGFPPHVEEQLFDLFFQYNRMMFEQQGAGTGLTIARELVQFHGGVIEVESVVEEGSTFTVVLPVYEGEPITPVSPDKKDGRRDATVLVVEDDFHLLVGLNELLEIFEGKYRLHVLTATNGREGLEELQKQVPNLIISDIMMPKMDGYAFLEAVRENPEWVQIPFIFLTAKGERRDIHKGWRSGVEEYITKPYDSDELLDLVVTQLDRHFQVQGVLSQNFELLKDSILKLIMPDFRLPLDSVNQYSQKLVDVLENVDTDEALKGSLEGIQEGSIRLTQLVEDFITLAELKTGEAETAYALRAQPIHDLGLIYQEVALMQRSQAEAAQVQLHYDIVESLPSIYGNSLALTDCMERLVTFAIHHGEEGPRRVEVTAVADDGEVCLSVTMPEPLTEAEEIALATPVLMEQEDTPSLLKDVEPSLLIVKGQAELHNGRIFAEPVAADRWRLTFALPIHRPEPERERSQVA